MANVEIKVENLSEEVSRMTHKIIQYDETINTYSDMCDDAKSDQTTSRSMINDLIDRVGKLEFDQEKLQPKLNKMNNEIIDLQCRNMRDNLIFTGIPEAETSEGTSEHPDGPEHTEHTLMKFLRDEMDIEENIGFHRVHRINVPEKNDDYPRPIVAKFERFKDREYVRSQAPKTLRGKSFGVREQFPKVVEKKRKLLYPEMNKAKQNKENKVRLVKDKLYINGKEYIPETTETDSDTETKQYPNPMNKFSKRSRGSSNYGYQRSYQNQTGTPRGYARGRTFKRSMNQDQFISGRRPRQTYAEKAVNFESPNLYSHLSDDRSNETIFGRCESRKNKASSPLDADVSVKKYRDLEEEYAEPIEMMMLNISHTHLQGESKMDDTNYAENIQIEIENQQNTQMAGENLLNDPPVPTNQDSGVTENQRSDQA